MSYKAISLEEVVAGFLPIVEHNPDFAYPHQGDPDETRCACIEVETDDDPDREYYEEHFLYGDCEWHMDDDNTCRYVKKDGSPACVVGHYFVQSLGIDDLNLFEKKMPSFILKEHGYEADKWAVRFLNTIQQQQDHGQDWTTSFESALEEAKYA